MHRVLSRITIERIPEGRVRFRVLDLAKAFDEEFGELGPAMFSRWRACLRAEQARARPHKVSWARHLELVEERAKEQSVLFLALYGDRVAKQCPVAGGLGGNPRQLRAVVRKLHALPREFGIDWELGAVEQAVRRWVGLAEAQAPSRPCAH